MKRELLITYLVTILLIYALWYILSLLLGSNLLPDPFLVLRQGISELDKSLFWNHVIASFFRILAGLFFGFLLAVPLGLFLGSNERL
ncbi:MAG: ABC-type nitrate/sulfonate/bicarbonate transport system, permease component, partial [Deltaproteobacteria bacterium]|nr:ABC-type nitrate/sulfonate/bicarbonate transport system, permease component [Deltaproteobacteria bacterium]